MVSCFEAWSRLEVVDLKSLIYVKEYSHGFYLLSVPLNSSLKQAYTRLECNMNAGTLGLEGDRAWICWVGNYFPAHQPANNTWYTAAHQYLTSGKLNMLNL